MKNSLFLAALLSLALSACGGGGGGGSAPEVTQPEPIDSTVAVNLGNEQAPATSESSSSSEAASSVASSSSSSVVASSSSSSSAAPVTWSTITPAKALSAGDIIRTMAARYPADGAGKFLGTLATFTDGIDVTRSTQMVAGDTSQYIKVVQDLCKQEAMSAKAEALMKIAPTPALPAADAAAFLAQYNDCNTIDGTGLSDVELAVAAQAAQKVPLDPNLAKLPPPPAPDAQEWAFLSEKDDAMGRIQMNRARAQAALGGGTPERDRRLNCLIDGLNKQEDAWRNSYSYSEVRAKIDVINAEYQTRLQAAVAVESAAAHR